MGAFGKMFTSWQHLLLLLLPLFTYGLPTPTSSPPSPSTPPSPSSPRPCTSSYPSQKQSPSPAPSSFTSPAPNSFTSPSPSSPRPSPSPSSPSSRTSSPAPTTSSSASPFPSSPRPTPSTGVKEKVEGDYEQTSPPSSNDWHLVKITAKPGSDKVFIWKNKAGVTWELILTNMEENFGVLLLVFKVGEDCPYVQLGYTQAQLFVREDKIEIEGPNGIYTKKN